MEKLSTINNKNIPELSSENTLIKETEPVLIDQRILEILKNDFIEKKSFSRFENPEEEYKKRSLLQKELIKEFYTSEDLKKIKEFANNLSEHDFLMLFDYDYHKKNIDKSEEYIENAVFSGELPIDLSDKKLFILFDDYFGRLSNDNKNDSYPYYQRVLKILNKLKFDERHKWQIEEDDQDPRINILAELTNNSSRTISALEPKNLVMYLWFRKNKNKYIDLESIKNKELRHDLEAYQSSSVYDSFKNVLTLNSPLSFSSGAYSKESASNYSGIYITFNEDVEITNTSRGDSLTLNIGNDRFPTRGFEKNNNSKIFEIIVRATKKDIKSLVIQEKSSVVPGIDLLKLAKENNIPVLFRPIERYELNRYFNASYNEDIEVNEPIYGEPVDITNYIDLL